MSVFASVIVNAISSNARMIFKFTVLLTFFTALTTFSIWFWGFMGDIYSILDNGFKSLSSELSSSFPLFNCLISILGIDIFLNSFFSMLYTALLFWITAVGYIVTFKLGNKVYDGILKAL